MSLDKQDDIFESFGPNSGYVKELFQLFLADPGLVSPDWAGYFQKIAGSLNGGTNGYSHAVPQNGNYNAQPATAVTNAASENQIKVQKLIDSFRSFGHYKAKINPLSKGITPISANQDVDLESYGFSDNDLSSEYATDSLTSARTAKLKDIIESLEKTYCGSVGYEYTHIKNKEEREWLRSKIEQSKATLSEQKKLRALNSLIEAETFENELHKKYIGAKRFSVEGGETMLPVLDTVLNTALKSGVKEAYIGMAHRGRLNVLVNTVGKPLEDIFIEFEDQTLYSVQGAGDVKYHMGYSGRFNSLEEGDLTVSLAPNPSHLEFVDPVVEGVVRARQDNVYPDSRNAVLPVLIHGDAAFIGQGIVYETINLSKVKGYKTFGTVHIVVNNQIGFTTNSDDARSTTYCSDGAKAFDIPVFHVNCEDIEAALWVSELATEYRMKFEKDVVIDIYCFRKYGHNEGDDPSFTQPLTYSELKGKKTAARLFGDTLIQQNIISQEQLDGFYKSYKDKFNAAQNNKTPKIRGAACSVHGRISDAPRKTAVDKKSLLKIAKTLTSVPDNFTIHPKLKLILEKRTETLNSGEGIDWGFAEALAYGSLLLDGKRIRLSGQDCGRGTFSHRHLALNNYEGPGIYWPLSRLAEEGGTQFEVYNSTLSEAAVLGFEFGYSATDPNALVMWEAQFGDFANGAQVLIDQFIFSSEAKWHQLSGVVLLLPHGFEGQGPEHSSARLERFLQLTGENNVTVAYPSNAAQHFHLLRRQGLSEIKRPLVVMTPKSLLRMNEATNKTVDFTDGSFKTIIAEDMGSKTAKHIVMLSGKIYYDVAAELKKQGNLDVKLIRVEQLYPFPQAELEKELKDIKVKSILWVQEEPQNMGSWTYIEPYIREKLNTDPKYVGRHASASPATGSTKKHALEQRAIVDEVISLVR